MIATSDCSAIAERKKKLVRLGLCMTGLLMAAVIFFHLPRLYSIHHEHMPALAGQRIIKELFLWPFVLGALWLFLRGSCLIQEASEQGGQRRTIVGFGVLFGLLAVCIPAFDTTDLRAYVSIGWQQTAYGANPYVHAVCDMPDWQSDPMFFEEHARVPPVYGFLFARLAHALAYLGAGNLVLTIALFKAVNLVVFLAAGWLVCRATRSLSTPAANHVAFLYFWNPLILLQILSNVHTDLIMGLLMTLGVVSACTGGWLLVMSVLVASVFIKYGSVVILPFVLLYLLRRHGWSKAALSTGLAAVVGFFCSAVYLKDAANFLFNVNAGNVTSPSNSIGSMLVYPMEVLAARDPDMAPWRDQAFFILKIASGLGFLAFCAALAWRRWRRSGYEAKDLLRDCVLLQFALICLASPKLFGWYVIMIYPLALFLPAEERLRRMILAITVAQVLSFTFIGRTHFLSPLVLMVVPLAWALWTGRKRSQDLPATVLDRDSPTPRRVAA